MSQIINGDCLKVMSEMEEDTIDAVVTDPPYGLSFMGKEWDHGIPGIPFWQETLRICKPGAHMLAFGGTRTHHRLMVAIEDAGWEIRDCLMWVYGSGFPKSLDVSKAIDKAAGAEREVVGKRISAYGTDTKTGDRVSRDNGGAGYWSGSGTKEVLLTGEPTTPAAIQWDGWGTALKPAWEPIILCRKPLEGTVANNVQKWGTGAINIDGCRVATDLVKEDLERGRTTNGKMGYSGNIGVTLHMNPNQKGRFPANFIHDGSDEVLELFPESTSGNRKRTNDNKNSIFGFGGGESFGDTGSAARFFYCGKASSSERNLGIDKNSHPTVKPVALLKYLCRLITPQNGTVLDPFAGSGSTGISAQEEGFNYVLIEINEEYYRIAKMRNAQETL